MLPENTADRFRILEAVLHPDDENRENADSDSEGLCGWGVWPLTHLIGAYGLRDFEASLELLREITKRGTSEFDVRHFIVTDQARTFRILERWKDDPNHHVRRLISEGTRPRLPWGIRLHSLVRDPKPGIALLQYLKDDPSEYVRRSVANHLNDIAKDHPKLVAELAADWKKGASQQRKRLLRHACRTLIKQGHPETLSVFGYHVPKIAEPELGLSPKKVLFGDELQLQLVVTSNNSRSQKLVIDYVLHFRKSNGSLSPKVFKWSNIELSPGETVFLKKVHSFAPITTRKYYPGKHTVTARINGVDFAAEPFDLIM